MDEHQVLPVHVVQQVLSLVINKYDRARCSLVCKEWKSLIPFISKPRLAIGFCGPLGSGKSTALGHLCWLLGSVKDEEMSEIRTWKEERRGAVLYEEEKHSPEDYAFVFDTLTAERVGGYTSHTRTRYVRTKRCGFTVVDTPGSWEWRLLTTTSISQVPLFSCFVMWSVEYDLTFWYNRLTPWFW